MAKITITNFEELIVSEERASNLHELLEEKKELNKQGGLPLSAWPITLESQDQMWCGSLADIKTITMNIDTKKRTPKYTFQSHEDLVRFHNEYGYGGLQTEFKPGYGLVDIQTQFLIKSKQAEIRNNQLIHIQVDKDYKEKWNDLFSCYLKSLNEFNEIC